VTQSYQQHSIFFQLWREFFFRLLCLLIPLTFGSLAFAAGEAPSFFAELAILMIGSALVAFLGFRIGLTPIVGFLLAGIVLGSFCLVQNQ
jgi:CPA2 family monovalent cation:H+ antiporter-2